MRIILFVCVLSFAGNYLISQNSQIDSVSVIYRAVPSGTTAIGSSQSYIKVYPELKVYLTQNNTSSKIYFKILSEDSTNVIYQSNYNMSSAAISVGGRKVFDKSSTNIYLSTPNYIKHEKYRFLLFTEDNLGIKSSIIEITK